MEDAQQCWGEETAGSYRLVGQSSYIKQWASVQRGTLSKDARWTARKMTQWAEQ